MLGVKRFIRTGTCGGIGRGLDTGDIVVATAAAPADGATRTYLHGDPFAPAADFELTRALVDARPRARRRARHRRRPVGRRLLQPRLRLRAKMRAATSSPFEMEAAALFYLAMRARGSGKDVRAALHPDRQRHAREGRDGSGETT